MKQLLILDDNVFNDVYLPYLDNNNDILIFYGGSSSGKSNFKASRVIYRILQGGRNYLVVRKVGNTLRDSVFPELRQAIYRWKLDKLFKINATEKEFTCINGYQIICRGLDDPEKIKSIIPNKGVLTDIWMEEATEFVEDDLNQLEHRLRGLSSTKKQIGMTFNPINISHWIKKRFFDSRIEDVSILKTTYKDNRFLTADDIKRIEKYKDIDPYYYQVYALGEWGVLGNTVYNNWEVKEFDDIFNQYYYGLDFGYSGSITGLVKLALRDNTIYVCDEWYQKGVQNNDIAKACLDIAGKAYIMCDSAEPKSIRELQLLGVNALPVKKGADSVWHGIQWVRQHRIVINPQCRNFINEIQTYKFREDKDGNSMKEPVKINDHLMDSLRYSLEHLMIYYRQHGFKIGDFGA